MYYILAALVIMYATCWRLAGESSIPIFLNMILPMIDHTTDVLYVSTVYFHNSTLFISAVVFLLLSGVLLIPELHNDAVVNGYPAVVKALPWKLLWLDSVKGYPTINGKLSKMIFAEHNTPAKGLWFLLVWCLLAFA